MTSYIALYTLGREGVSGMIYGIAAFETIEESEKIASFAKKNGFRTMTGHVYTPDQLIEAALNTYPQLRNKTN